MKLMFNLIMNIDMKTIIDMKLIDSVKGELKKLDKSKTLVGVE